MFADKKITELVRKNYFKVHYPGCYTIGNADYSLDGYSPKNLNEKEGEEAVYTQNLPYSDLYRYTPDNEECWTLVNKNAFKGIPSGEQLFKYILGEDVDIDSLTKRPVMLD